MTDPHPRPAAGRLFSRPAALASRVAFAPNGVNHMNRTHKVHGAKGLTT